VLRTSTVTFDFTGGFASGSFVWDGGYAVSAGQPWEGITSSAPGQEVSIQVLAGRHGTSEVAEWFRQRATAAAPNNVGLFASEGFGQWPSELNFAFTGTLTAKLQITNDDGGGGSVAVVIGQGPGGLENSFENIWWVGGESWTPGQCSGQPGLWASESAEIFIVGGTGGPFPVVTYPC
jgi:hypothetical protein